MSEWDSFCPEHPLHSAPHLARTPVDFDTFESAEVYRPKTDGDEGETVLGRLEIPEMLRGPLKAWWTRVGKRATCGPVFPVMNGKRVGERQAKRSHARELRAALWQAGIHRSLPGFEEAMEAMEEAREHLEKLTAKPEGRLAYRRALQELAQTTRAAKALDMLQSDTARYRRLDFHSFRRAFNTALGAAGVNVQQAMALTGALPLLH